MRLYSCSFVTVLTFLLVLNPQEVLAKPSCHVGQDLDVLYQGYWLPSDVLQTQGTRCFIRYKLYGEGSEEWVTADRIRIPDFSKDIPVGTKLKVEYSGEWYAATVLRSRGARYFITYDGWSSTWDEWVGEERIQR